MTLPQFKKISLERYKPGKSKLSKIKKTSKKTIITNTTNNFKKLFKLI